MNSYYMVYFIFFGVKIIVICAVFHSSAVKDAIRSCWNRTKSSFHKNREDTSSATERRPVCKNNTHDATIEIHGRNLGNPDENIPLTNINPENTNSLEEIVVAPVTPVTSCPVEAQVNPTYKEDIK